jgi:RNA-binding protein YlmH
MTVSVYQHFRSSEYVFIDKVLDWLSYVSDNYDLVTTDFLNPRQVFILKTLVNANASNDVRLYLSSLLFETEYVRVILAPNYYELDLTDFDLACLRIDFAHRFVSLKHSQILGTLLGETGLERSKIGDIALHQNFAQVLVTSKLSTLFIEKITQIAKSGVKLSEVSLTSFKLSADNSIVKVVTISSLRLDNVIASLFNISRNLAQNLIQSSKVKVNYVAILRNDFELHLHDLVSVRRLGRLTITQNMGLTKKNKLRIEVKVVVRDNK